MNPKLLAIVILAAICGSGCVYKLNVNQGNRITAEDVAKVETGMTRSQVRFLLGTPMIADPFHEDRWDYVYFFRSGKSGRHVQRHFVVIFENERVAQVIDEQES